jgi:predicted GNAT family acetyltransferase
MSVTVRDNPTDNRYDIYLDDELAGFTTYQLTGDQTAFTHTETFPAFAGQGLAKQLVTQALDDARRRGLVVLPFCPYVRKFIAQNTATYLDLVPENERERFGLVPANN